ncbi:MULTISPECIES: universal stress protein [Streptomycetaceae]|uniref:UspA domain-containing protein n=1 Tax=Streptantibioticus cattleyicolor (strain ATCC 35852 / DSM 46488 / JCM 4925 / NBRC 14057 / NRRL 8057) TaxID=1003195 RepID=F8JWW3_STREN|nr:MULTISPECIES: universal stress protein [Streptomycetaceae]AEW93009.1 hypothetical protein SCATT_06380 [Streptantibioticus cattleyicolor NRRL 8057 = DSM 46488]MYS57745.1 universal stress protein [Streptomyces sp. SID5468]CCB73369.1 putative stress-inducible protein [Streptantibioticus cattleyicolor NRRL 8057 = DSM 46488]
METRPVVVGTDGSALGTEAVDWAADEAARHRCPLRIVYASLWERYEAPPAPAPGERVAADAAERARGRHAGLPVTAAVVPDEPGRVLVAESDEALAVVVGQRGRGELAALLLGSVSLRTAAHARCPVIVVRGTPRARTGAHCWIALAVAAGGGSDAAVEFAFREASVRGCGIDAVHAWRWPQGPELVTAPGPDTAAERIAHAERVLDDALAGPAARHPGIQVRRGAVEGPARKALLEVSAASDLLVIGTLRHPHPGPGPQLGPVVHALLHHAPCPVAVVPQPARPGRV